MEFESIKHALSCREEELVLAGTQLLELGRLRDLAEHQLQEALEALQAEREQKQELRRELAICTGGRHDSLSSLQANLEELNHSRAEEQDSGFANASSIGSMASTPHSIRPAPGLVADLFSELNLAEIHKLQQQLLQVSRLSPVDQGEVWFQYEMTKNVNCIPVAQWSKMGYVLGQCEWLAIPTPHPTPAG